MAFSSVGMSKINLFIQTENLDKLSHLLYDLKLIQFFDLKQDNFEKFEHSDLNEISHKLLETRSTIRTLKTYFKVNTNDHSENPIDETRTLLTKLADLNKKKTLKSDELKRTNILRQLKVTTEELNTKTTTIGFIPSSKTKYLKKLIANKITFRTYNYEHRTYFVANTGTELPFEFKSLYLPKTLDETLSSKLEKLQVSIKKVKLDLRKLANNNLEHLRAKEHHLTKEIELIESKPQFAKTENLVVISGFMPSKQIRKLKIELIRLLTDKFELTTEKATADETPIKLNHSQSVGNFVELLKMYSLPKYNEIDPTFFLFLTFPLFFGFILGDVVYGAISLFIFTLLKIKMPKIKEFLSILQMSAVSSIIFGVIFGEFMGFEIHGHFYGLIARSHEANTLLLFAVIFGLLHINLGLILGFVNELKNLKKAICDKLSFIILQFGVGFLAYGINITSNLLVIIGSVLMVLAAALIYMSHGFIGIMEIPSFFTNILSYARLMAVGLSSVVIAMLINQYTAVFFANGIFGIFAGIVLFSLGHVFNIALGNFEGFVHTLRLHYVEQMTKFYSGGGVEFKPFGERKVEQD